jgi:hypothetical protein
MDRRFPLRRIYMTALTHPQAAIATSTDSFLDDEQHEGVVVHDMRSPLRIRVAERCFDWREHLPTLREAREAFDRVYLEELLRRVDGNVSAAARVAGRNRTDLYDVLRRAQVDPAHFRPARGPESEHVLGAGSEIELTSCSTGVCTPIDVRPARRENLNAV